MLKNRSVLLVDDDEEDREIFMDVLKEIEPTMHFSIASNGEEAIQKLSIQSLLPSFILMDINMPVMNGLECLHILKGEQKFKSIPVVMLTTSSDPPTAKQALKLGATFFLTKAGRLTDIRSQLQHLLEKDLLIAH